MPADMAEITRAHGSGVAPEHSCKAGIGDRLANVFSASGQQMLGRDPEFVVPDELPADRIRVVGEVAIQFIGPVVAPLTERKAAFPPVSSLPSERGWSKPIQVTATCLGL